MNNHWDKLQTIISTKYKMHLPAKILETFGIIGFFLQLFEIFDIDIRIFPSLGWKGLLYTMAICLLIIFLDFVIFKIKLHTNIIKCIYNIDCINNTNGCKYELISDGKALVEKNIQIVNEAKEGIYTTGSRSRDSVYLNAIESKIANDENMIYYRVLYGNPHNQILKDHLERVIDNRDPKKRPHGKRTIYLSIYDKFKIEPEKFVCANENEALVVLPSFNNIGNYDTAIVFYEKDTVDKLCNYVRILYSSGKPLDSKRTIKELKLSLSEEKNDL